MRVLSLYIHTPFCTRRCSYCSFYHVPRYGADPTRFIDSLVDEMECAIDALDAAAFGGFGTVFIGGGTPSVLGRRALNRMFDALDRYTERGAVAEVTCELNPEDVDADLLALLARRGVNRVSLGVQSLEPAAQRVLKRCAPETNRRAVDLVLDRFDNVSFDVLLGIPGSTVAATADTIDELADRGPAHFSVYCLEPGGDVGNEVAAFFDGVDPERCADEYLLVCGELARRGYRHYEISNFARPGFESAHNRVYWSGRDYLGVGPGAHSSIDGVRFHNAPSISQYLSLGGADRIAARVVDPVGRDGRDLERTMLALRTDSGMPLSWARCGRGEIDALVENGLARIADERLVLTDRGFLVANDIVLRVNGNPTTC
jgi:oxygen-independent coproporphyrinogen-3 oxidase